MSTTASLDIWDVAKASAPRARARIVIERFGGLESNVAASLPIGARDHSLLTIRRTLFGSRMELLATCPSCGGVLEFEIDAGVLETSTVALIATAEVTSGELRLVCRAPTQSDLVAATAGNPPLNVSRRRLFEACTMEATRNGAPVHADELGEDAVTAASTMFADLDSAADIRFGLHCDGCGHSWDALFDPPSLLWAEFDAWANGQLEEIRQLALMYGWTERDILGMSHARRRFYLEAGR
jgi:hypothetical protein